MKYISILASLVFFMWLTGCATTSDYVEPSIYLLSTNKEPRSFLNEVAKDLESKRYKVGSLDLNLGLLVMEPRRFVISRDGEKASAEQTIQIRQEGGSVKLRISYICEYEDEDSECDAEDRAAKQKIRKIERLLLSIVNRKLIKKRGEKKSKAKIIE